MLIFTALPRKLSGLPLEFVNGLSYNGYRASGATRLSAWLRSLGIIERMNISTKRFLVHSTLLTAGVALIILHASSLSAYGLGLFLISHSYSGYRKGKLPSIWWLVALTVLCGAFFVWDLARGVAFSRQPIPSWLEILFAAVWAFDITVEFRGWLSKRRFTHDA
jgi:hypothetical protein